MEQEDLFPGRTTTRPSSRSSRASPRTSCSPPPRRSCALRPSPSWASRSTRRCGCSCARPGGPQRFGDRRAAARPRLHRPSARLRTCSRSGSTGTRWTTTCRSARSIPLASTSPSTCPGRSPDVDRRRAGARGGRAPAQLGRRLSDALVVSIHGAQMPATSSRAATPALFPDYYKCAARSTWRGSTSPSSSSLSADPPYVVALQNERDMAEPLTRLKLYKTGGKAPLTDLLPLLETARPDGGRGGPDPAPGRRR